MNEMSVTHPRCGRHLWCHIQGRDRKLSSYMFFKGSADTAVAAYLGYLVAERRRHS